MLRHFVANVPQCEENAEELFAIPWSMRKPKCLAIIQTTGKGAKKVVRGLMSLRLTTKFFKRGMTRKCDFPQVDFVHKEFEDAANLHSK